MVLYSAMAPKALWKPKGHAKAKAACKLVDKDSVGEKSRWQFRAGRFVYQKHIDLAKVLEHFGDKVSEYSVAHEAGTHDHTDVYLVFVKKQDWTSMEPCTIDGHVPHFTANTTSGSGYRNACNRGHFYNQCEGKKGTTARVTNHPPGEAYAVKTQWIADLYQQGKLDTPLTAAVIYKCLTPQLEAMVYDSWISKNFHVVEVKESLVADPSASPSSCKQSQSPKRLKKFDDADPPVKKAPAHYVFKGEPVPHSEASFAFE